MRHLCTFARCASLREEPADSSGVYICKSVVNDLRHGNYICKSEVNLPERGAGRSFLSSSRMNHLQTTIKNREWNVLIAYDRKSPRSTSHRAAVWE